MAIATALAVVLFIGVVLMWAWPDIMIWTRIGALERRQERMHRMLADSVPLCRQFSGLFPNHDVRVAYPGVAGREKVTMTAIVYGRYVIAAEVPIRLALDEASAAIAGDSRFYVKEVVASRPLATGGYDITMGWSREFGRDLWGSVVDARGRIESVFPNVVVDAPVAGVENAR